MYIPKFIISGLLVCLDMAGWARPVTAEQALRQARDFYESKEVFGGRFTRSLSVEPRFDVAYMACRERKVAVRSAGASDDVCYYVVNVNDNEGFVVVSGDDRARPILAYSLNGGFMPGNLPANCRAWLQGYQEEISLLKDIPESETECITPVFRDAVFSADVIRPMLQTQWAQGAPFNMLCPADNSSVGSDRNCVVGCVATAMAQLMYYHRWPQRPTGKIRYLDRAQKVEREYDFDGNPAFDWDNMLVRYTDVAATEAQRQEVARLSLCAGYACKMAYSLNLSTAYLKDAAAGLLNYFGYDTGIHRHLRSLTPFGEWVDILMEELKAGRPVLYEGFNNEGGHAFLCDGYDGEGLFHFNWGWGGLSDGYYSLSAMNPKMQSIGGSNGSYAFRQTMVCRIQPPAGFSEPQPDRVYMSSLYSREPAPNYNYVSDGVVEASRDEIVGVGCWIATETVAEFKTAVCAGIMRNGAVMPLTAVREMTFPAENGSQSFASDLDLSVLDEGVYELGLYYKGTDGNWQIINAEQSVASGIRIVIKADKVTMEHIRPEFRLTLADDFQPGLLYVTGRKTWQFRLANVGAVRLEGWAGVRMRNEEAGIDTLFKSLVYCESGEEVLVKISADLAGLPSGDYLLTPYYCAVNGIYTTPTVNNVILLGEGVTVTATRMPVISIMSPSEGFRFNRAEGSLTATVSQPSSRIPYAGRIYGEVFRRTAEGEEATGVRLYSGYLELTKPSVTDVEFMATESVDLPLGDDYTIVFYLDDGYGVALLSGSLTVEDNGNAVRETKNLPEINYRKADASVDVCMPEDGSVHILNAAGLVVRDVSMAGGIRKEISVRDFPSGAYIVRLVSDGGVRSKVIVISK